MVLLGHKNQNQGLHKGGLIDGEGLNEGVIPAVTQVLSERWAYLRGGLIGGEIRYVCFYSKLVLI